MRILFTGAAPWVNSGYGKPGRYLFPRLAKAGHQIALACFFGYRGGTTVTDVGGAKVRIFSVARDSYFNDIIEYHAGSFGADVVISLQDVWLLKDWGTPKGFVWCPRFPIDTHPISKPILKAIEGCHTPLAMSQWGQKELQEHGWPQARYIPLGVDLEVYRPQDQAEARQKAGLPQDVFIAGMVAANSSSPSRKSFPEVLLAWKRWREGGGEGLLYLHTTITPKRQSGMDFLLLLETLGMDWTTEDDPDAERKARATVMFPCQHRMWCGAYNDESLAHLYNSFDVLLNPSMAEGFGIPIIEAQACGIPVVTLNVTSMPEITFAGMCLEPVQMAWEDQGGWRGVAGVKDLAEALQWAYQMSKGPKARQYHREKGRANVERFSFDRLVEEKWLPFLKELGED